MQNQIYKRSLSDMIQHGDESNRPSYVADNQTVTTETHRRSGCYLATGYKSFILDGETLDVYKGAGGTPVCTGYQDRCSDGTLSRSTTSACLVQKVVSECRVTGSNAGCSRTASCPAGKQLVSAAAACNLEYGEVSSSQLAAVAAGEVQVVRTSDHVSEGRCRLGATTISSGHRAAEGVIDVARVSCACSEHDSNGGDCHVKAALFCR
jgi:hypothetical protein